VGCGRGGEYDQCALYACMKSHNDRNIC
jgi:hypothetical protein